MTEHLTEDTAVSEENTADTPNTDRDASQSVPPHGASDTDADSAERTVEDAAEHDVVDTAADTAEHDADHTAADSAEHTVEDAAEHDADDTAEHTVEDAAEHDADDTVEDTPEDDAEPVSGHAADDIAHAPAPKGRTPTSGSRRQHLEREGEVAADFLETLLDICDLDGDIDVDIDGDRAAISVVDSEDGRVPRRLVGQEGNVLEALQEITRLAVQSATGERSRLMLDVAGHRAGRRRVLVEVAARVIDQVKDSGERQALDPMTAFERKVVHDEVLAAGLGSESEGSEPRRYVVILPA